MEKLAAADIMKLAAESLSRRCLVLIKTKLRTKRSIRHRTIVK